MKKWRTVLTSIADRTDFPGHIFAHLPYITMEGFGEISIDLQQGLISYAETEIEVKVAIGTVKILGSGLYITLMREGKITVKGCIDSVQFCRETEQCGE